MNQRDRLVELISEYHEQWKHGEGDWKSGLADHLIANGVIVPPCKVGDTVYITENPYSFLLLKKPLEGEVMSIHQHKHGLYLRVLFDGKKINGSVDYNLNWRLNKDIFLNREDAEKALEGKT